jgi:nicotinamidase-related amidase
VSIIGSYTAPEFDKSALVTIDVQRDVLEGQPLEVPGSSAAADSIGRLADCFRAAARPIVHIVRLYERDGSNVDPCRRHLVERGAAMLTPGSSGSELAPGVLPNPRARLDSGALLAGAVQEIGVDEVVMYKPRWGAFYETPLEAHLRANGTSTIVLCGFNFPNCPRTSLYEASERDFRVVAVTDAISGLYERGARELEAIGITLSSTSDVIEAIRAGLALGPAEHRGSSGMSRDAAGRDVLS